MSSTMKAWVIREAGGPEAFELSELPRPQPRQTEVLVRVQAFGLNRSEYFTRIGESPSVIFPRVLGIECAGTVEFSPSGRFRSGQKVFAMMGGMGREFDGSYAEYTCVTEEIVFPFESELGWDQLGALPEMLQTCHGSLHTGLEVESGETLLIRGGTSSIGMTTMALAKAMGVRVALTTRNADKRELLLERGADEVYVDEGILSDKIREVHPQGVDRVLELIGTKTLLDSLQCVRSKGVVCMTGILGGEWELKSFQPMGQIPTGVKLSSYSGGASDISASELQRYVKLVDAGSLTIHQGPVWSFNQLREAHEALDANQANGKMVVVVG
jgi:NADPH:quinone reductase-like Zn-dependent oxidoreductase